MTDNIDMNFMGENFFDIDWLKFYLLSKKLLWGKQQQSTHDVGDAYEGYYQKNQQTWLSAKNQLSW